MTAQFNNDSTIQPGHHNTTRTKKYNQDKKRQPGQKKTTIGDKLNEILDKPKLDLLDLRARHVLSKFCVVFSPPI